ncbi:MULTISPECIES: response regulator transcription factor [unclassified Pseudomonas]|uniref:response regulator transcription factor n=1 Tax=unclassified Pseudomonas TaxID=196821 RepID=UPI000A1DA344|nr:MULTISPECIES: response regulator transcription factor [unclassified Pseudomonas]MDI2145075.1 response regulator transcription factor [Pseudomonas sp. ITA]
MGSVVFAEDHPVVALAIRILLQELGYKEIHVVSRGVDVVPMIRKHSPELVILDLNLPGTGGLAVLERIQIIGIVCKVVIFTSADPAHFMVRCRQAGAMAFVNKSAELRQLQNAIKAVRSGYSYFPELPAVNAGQPGVHSNEKALIERLSNREMYILLQLAHGKSNKLIAEEMSLSHKTISTYKTRLMLKLGMSSLVLLREFVKRNGLF